jgi:hypothetical protein
VVIKDQLVKTGTGSYKIDACGEPYDYEHSGTVVFEKGQGPHQK